MRWDQLPRSDRVEDRRGRGPGGGFRLPGGRGGLGIGFILILMLVGWLLGIDPRILIGGAEVVTGGRQTQQVPQPDPRTKTGAPADQASDFVSAVLGSTEAQWTAIFSQAGRRYEPPNLVMFSGATSSACGFAHAAMGPFYCPNDRKVYLDTSFFEDLARRLGACDVGSKSCQFAQAYVIAHEIGHHVQNLLDILPRVQQAQRGVDQVEANNLQVRVELQADCLAGVWAHHSQEKWGVLEPGDIETALRTAAAIGDDRLQRRGQGYVVPDAFTHGSSEQRARWLTTGLKSGSFSSCDTFKAAQL